MYIYIYIYSYVCIYIYIYTYVYIHTLLAVGPAVLDTGAHARAGAAQVHGAPRSPAKLSLTLSCYVDYRCY